MNLGSIQPHEIACTGFIYSGVEKEWPDLVNYGGKSVVLYTTSVVGDDEMSPRCWKAWNMRQIQVLCYCYDGSRYEALLLKPTHPTGSGL